MNPHWLLSGFQDEPFHQLPGGKGEAARPVLSLGPLLCLSWRQEWHLLSCSLWAFVPAVMMDQRFNIESGLAYLVFLDKEYFYLQLLCTSSWVLPALFKVFPCWHPYRVEIHSCPLKKLLQLLSNCSTISPSGFASSHIYSMYFVKAIYGFFFIRTCWCSLCITFWLRVCIFFCKDPGKLFSCTKLRSK